MRLVSTQRSRFTGTRVSVVDNRDASFDDGAGFAFKPQYVANLTGGNGGLFFGGPNAVAAFGGPVPLFTPAVWATSSRSVTLSR